MQRLIQIPFLLLAIVLMGSTGLYLLTEQSFLHCFYQAFILLSTVGSQEPFPLNERTMLFIVAYLACGLGVFAYSAFQFGHFLVNSDLRSVLERRRMESRIKKLSGHFIVCSRTDGFP